MVRNLFNSAVYVEAYGLVKAYVLSNSGQNDDVRDTLQEGLLIFFRKANSKEIVLDCKLAYFIFGICKNVWRKELKKRQGEVLSDGFDDIEDCFEEDLRNKEKEEVLQNIIRRCIPKLSKKCQDVLYLRLEGLSCTDIAELMNFDSGNITRNKTHTCKNRLKELVKKDPEYIRLFGPE